MHTFSDFMSVQTKIVMIYLERQTLIIIFQHDSKTEPVFKASLKSLFKVQMII